MVSRRRRKRWTSIKAPAKNGLSGTVSHAWFNHSIEGRRGVTSINADGVYVEQLTARARPDTPPARP